DLYDRVARHRPFGFAIGHAKGAEIRFLSPLEHQRRDAGDGAGARERLERGVDAGARRRRDQVLARYGADAPNARRVDAPHLAHAVVGDPQRAGAPATGVGAATADELVGHRVRLWVDARDGLAVD